MISKLSQILFVLTIKIFKDDVNLQANVTFPYKRSHTNRDPVCESSVRLHWWSLGFPLQMQLGVRSWHPFWKCPTVYIFAWLLIGAFGGCYVVLLWFSIAQRKLEWLLQVSNTFLMKLVRRIGGSQLGETKFRLQIGVIYCICTV